MKMVSFLSLVKQYKAVWLDSYGVVKNHKGLIPEVQKTIDFLRKEGKVIRILTNDASKSQEEQGIAFRKLGLSGIDASEIITSGMLAKQFLMHKIPKGKVAYLGTDKAAEYILESGLESIPVSDLHVDDDINAFVFLDDEGFDWNIDINKTVNLLRRKNIPVILANSDKLYPVNKNDVSIATGGIARLIESILNRRFIYFGKPDSQMFMYAFEHMNHTESDNFTKDDILMVGDTLHTDILGGNKFGVKTMLVMTGNTRKEHAQLRIEYTGIIPDYLAESICI